MRYPASEKLEIVRTLEASHLPVKQTSIWGVCINGCGHRLKSDAMRLQVVHDLNQMREATCDTV